MQVKLETVPKQARITDMRLQSVIEWGPASGRLAIAATNDLRLEEREHGILIILKTGESCLVPYPNVKQVVYAK